jgi:Prenyltransferase and squalene oxidase repeat
MTPLMLPVASDHANPEIVRMLLAKNPDVRAESELGETALGWAAKFKQPAVLPIVQKASLGVTTPGGAPTVVGRAGISDVRQAAEKSMALMQSTTVSFFREGGCVRCHAQHITGMAVVIARQKGLRYDEPAAEEVLRATRLEFGSRADQFLERVDGPSDAILTTALYALAFQSVPGDRVTDAMIRSIASQQYSDGHWSGTGIVRPPTSDGDLSITAASIHVLRHYGAPALKEEMDARTAHAMQWLLQTEPSTTEDAVMQLLGAKWGGADSATLDRFRRKVLTLQREDGGWAQTPQLPSDAYGTATALYALYEGGGTQPSDAAYRRGVQFLLRTQAADGS